MAQRDEDAPWLAEAAPLRALPRKRPFLNVAIAVLALGAVAAVALLMLLGRRDGGSTQGYMEAAQAPLIEADPGPFRVPPTDRQGMEVDGEGEVIHEAVRGENPGSVIDMGAMPEEPVGRPRDLMPAAPGATAAPAGQPAPVQVVPAGPPAAVQVRPAPVRPAAAPPSAAAPTPAAVPTPSAAPAAKPSAPPIARPAPVVAAKPAPAKTVSSGGSGTVQIGAFSSEAKAQEEWARVGGKAGLSGRRIEKVTSASGKTLWRVRGAAADVDAACKAILAAKGACEAVKT